MNKTCLSILLILFQLSCIQLSETKVEQGLDSLINFCKNGDYEICIQKGQLFTKEYPQNDRGFLVLGTAYLSMGIDSSAETNFNRSLEINKNNAGALTSLGIIHDRREQYNDAADFYEKAINIDSNLAQAYSNYASNRATVGDYNKALVLAEKAIYLANNIKDKAVLCFIYHKVGQFENRDSLLNILESSNYPNLNDLRTVLDR